MAALASRLRLRGLRAHWGLAAWRWQVHVLGMRWPHFSYSGHHLRPVTDSAHCVVRRLLAVRQWQGRRLGPKPEANAGDRLLPDGGGNAASATVGAGAPWPGPAIRYRGGG